jgi:hypothetical protein
MTKKLILIVGLSVILFLIGCSSDKIISPEAIMLVSSVNNSAPLMYDPNSTNGNTVPLEIKTINGVGVDLVSYRTIYYYSDMTPITESNLNKTGVISQFIEGYSQATVNINVITPEVLEFVKQNPDSDEDDIKNLVVKIILIGVDENENQVSTEANVEVFF